jgi:hypothetical protein
MDLGRGWGPDAEMLRVLLAEAAATARVGDDIAGGGSGPSSSISQGATRAADADVWVPKLPSVLDRPASAGGGSTLMRRCHQIGQVFGLKHGGRHIGSPCVQGT